MKIPGERKKIVYRTVCELAGVKCDACGRVIKAPSEQDQYNWLDDKYKFYVVTTGHNDWGNDSFESVRQYDICPECITKFVSDYLADKKGYRSAYIDIETKHLYYGDEVENDD